MDATAQNQRVWTKDEIKSLLEKDAKFVGRAIVKLFEKQTRGEQDSDQTMEDNGVGFNGFDAEILSNFAKFFMKTGFLTKKQLAIARKKVIKYAKQLTMIANGKI